MSETQAGKQVVGLAANTGNVLVKGDFPKSVLDYLIERIPERRIFSNAYGKILVIRELRWLSETLDMGVALGKFTAAERADFVENFEKLCGGNSILPTGVIALLISSMVY